jgi:hypothetical protein
MNGLDRAAQEVRRRPARDLLVRFDKGEIGRAIDGHEQVELAMHLGDADRLVVRGGSLPGLWFSNQWRAAAPLRGAARLCLTIPTRTLHNSDSFWI